MHTHTHTHTCTSTHTHTHQHTRYPPPRSHTQMLLCRNCAASSRILQTQLITHMKFNNHFENLAKWDLQALAQFSIRSQEGVWETKRETHWQRVWSGESLYSHGKINSTVCRNTAFKRLNFLWRAPCLVLFSVCFLFVLFLFCQAHRCGVFNHTTYTQYNNMFTFIHTSFCL